MNNKQRDQAIKQLYLSGKYTTEQVAAWHHITPRAVQRIAKRDGYIRSQSESNKLMAPLKHYQTIPVEFRVKRKHISRRIRYMIISDHPYCTTCGSRPEDGVRLEVDHIDNNPQNNEDSNLQVLCGLCNVGKSQLDRFKK